MKVVGFWVLFMVVGTALMVLAFSSSSSFSIPDMVLTSHADSVTATATNRKLKEMSQSQSTEKKKKKRDAKNMNLEDYHLIDPVPSSKASIKSGPIEHGTPLMPYIPKLAPPSHPKPGGSP